MSFRLLYLLCAKELKTSHILLTAFIKEYSKIYNKVINDIEDHTLDVLMNYYWPGNVRELENVIEYTVVRAKEEIIRLENLPSSIKSTFDIEKTCYRI